MQDEDIAKQFIPILEEKGVNTPFETVVGIVALLKERVHFIKELWDQSSFFFVTPESYDEKTVSKRWKSDSHKHMSQLTELLKQAEDFSSDSLESTVKDWIQTNELHMGNIMNAFRLAIVGESKGPHMFNITELIGKEETIKRMELALARLPKSEE